MRDFKRIDSTLEFESGEPGFVELLEETLSDGSKAYTVQGTDIYQDQYVLDCVDELKAGLLFDLLTTVQRGV